MDTDCRLWHLETIAAYNCACAFFNSGVDFSLFGQEKVTVKHKHEMASISFLKRSFPNYTYPNFVTTVAADDLATALA